MNFANPPSHSPSHSKHCRRQGSEITYPKPSTSQDYPVKSSRDWKSAKSRRRRSKGINIRKSGRFSLQMAIWFHTGPLRLGVSLRSLLECLSRSQPNLQTKSTKLTDVDLATVTNLFHDQHLLWCQLYTPKWHLSFQQPRI